MKKTLQNYLYHDILEVINIYKLAKKLWDKYFLQIIDFQSKNIDVSW